MTRQSLAYSHPTIERDPWLYQRRSMPVTPAKAGRNFIKARQSRSIYKSKNAGVKATTVVAPSYRQQAVNSRPLLFPEPMLYELIF